MLLGLLLLVYSSFFFCFLKSWISWTITWSWTMNFAVKLTHSFMPILLFSFTVLPYLWPIWSNWVAMQFGAIPLVYKNGLFWLFSFMSHRKQSKENKIQNNLYYEKQIMTSGRFWDYFLLSIKDLLGHSLFALFLGKTICYSRC